MSILGNLPVKIQAAIVAFKHPWRVKSHRFITCYLDSKLPEKVERLHLHSSAFKAGDELLIQNMLLRVVDCELRIHVEKIEG